MSQKVRDLVTIYTGEAGPSGDKANYIRDKAADSLDMTVVEFCENVVECNNIFADQPTESYVRKVLKECNPESVAQFETDELTFA